VKWAGRVSEWRRSGKLVEEFAEGKGFQASTLRYWASRLKKAKSEPVGTAPVVRMARVVRRERVNLQTDPSNCGYCNLHCSANQACNNGRCGLSPCEPGEVPLRLPQHGASGGADLLTTVPAVIRVGAMFVPGPITFPLLRAICRTAPSSLEHRIADVARSAEW
jgi:hypothetical protein